VEEEEFSDLVSLIRESSKLRNRLIFVDITEIAVKLYDI
jgi:hypothetical protein